MSSVERTAQITMTLTTKATLYVGAMVVTAASVWAAAKIGYPAALGMQFLALAMLGAGARVGGDDR